MSASLLDKKLEYWEHQLLDLGKRNKMINYRETKRTTIKLAEPSFDALYKRLAINEETLTFQRPVDRETDIRVFSILSLLENMSAPLPVTIGDIKTEGSIIERQRTLKNLRSKSRLAQEEQGTNILYLSFGFIEWKDGKGASAQWIKSPLILVPAVLALEALNAPYTLKKHEDDIVVNPTLEYYLKTEYGIELPHFDADNDTLDDFFVRVEAIANQRGWRIVREVSLGLLSFLKISMYNDLLRNEVRIKKNAVVRAMAGDAAEANNIPGHLKTFDLDSIGPLDCYQVMSADSSQQEAVLYSKNKLSFVMQGPPGTGKSQTITNIIAEALAEGKKVLFVSEKMAALQVVYRRLQEAHLGDFCLPLHSYKANKKEILEQIGANLKLKQTRVKDAAINNLEELLSIRRELNQYASELHALNPELNLSCYEVYSKLEEVSAAPTMAFVLEDPLGTSQGKLQAYVNTLQAYALAVNRLDCFIQGNPWQGLSSRRSDFEFGEQMRLELGDLAEQLKCISEALCAVDECPGLDGKIRFDSVPELANVLTQICALPDLPEQWVAEYNYGQAMAAAGEAKAQYENLRALRSEIGAVFEDTAYGFDGAQWKRKLLADASRLAALPLTANKPTEHFIRDLHVLQAALKSVLDSLADANEAVSAINDALGTDFDPGVYDHQICSAILGLLQTNIRLQKQWLSADADLEKIKLLIKEAQTMAAEVQNCKALILRNWDAEILDLDYAPILLRYKTDYTSFFKIFNSQYNRDKKQIQALSKGILKKLPDAMAVEILSALKQYREKLEWFSSHNRQLQTALGNDYAGLNSNWDLALKAIGIAEEVKKRCAGNVPDALADAFAQEHSRLCDQLIKIASRVGTALSMAEAVAKEQELAIGVGLPEFDYIATEKIISRYLHIFEELQAQFDILQPHLKNKNETVDAVFDAIAKLNAYSALNSAIVPLVESYKKQFGSFYKGENTPWDTIIDLLGKTEKLKQSPVFSLLIPAVHGSDQRKKTLERIAASIENRCAAAGAPFVWVSNQFVQADLQELPIQALYEKVTGCLRLMDKLGSWVDYQEARENCLHENLGDFIKKIESNELYAVIEPVFLKGFYQMWLGAVCDKSASVRRFRRNTQDERVKKFMELDDLQLRIAQMRIRERLIEGLPTTHQMLKATDEMAILNKELGKRRNIMPLRKLFRQIPNLLLKLKPCLMMSPLSVSYFLETEAYHFDLVIFDEASQIFPEDAIGAIFRGSQVIIAGDSKQLPPTDFFSSTTNNFDGDYDIDDDGNDEIVSDSILEEAASVLPNRTLLWHYRSKHENLIAFSNREIYKNSLITFPGSVTNVPDMGVEYIYVEDGCYDRGGRKNNVREAQECVRLVLEHIKKHPDRSLGIIAFSESQQTTIEDAIIDLRERNPEYEWFFDEARDEPFFVKNLENVQGDERDTIIFSICYGRDKAGKMYMNFGPVGHQGGERRLNVAITRAKCNIKLVGSIVPADIDPERAKSEGARMLRAYIEFARKGAGALKPVEQSEVFESQDDFCRIVAAFLEQHGYQVRRQVGCSDYRIDIAVVNPEADGAYIAGIECDGLSYAHAKTARDRDHLRKTVLENMGWNLYRVWSTAWSRNPKAEGAALLAFIKSVYDKSGKDTCSVKQSNVDDMFCVEEIAVETAKRSQTVDARNPYAFLRYKEANWWEARHDGTFDTMDRVAETILHIVRTEEPLHMELLYKRMGPSFTSGKATESVRNTIDEAIAERLQDKVVVDGERFIRSLPLKAVAARIPEVYDTPRPMEYIHTEEVANAMVKIVENSFGITEEDLATECARAFGFERKGPKIKAKTDAAIRYLITTHKIRVIDGKAQLTGE